MDSGVRMDWESRESLCDWLTGQRAVCCLLLLLLCCLLLLTLHIPDPLSTTRAWTSPSDMLKEEFGVGKEERAA